MYPVPIMTHMLIILDSFNMGVIASSIYFRSLCLRGSDLGRRLHFMSWIFFYFGMYLCWDLFGSCLHFHDWWHGYRLDEFWFSTVTFYVEICSCMTTWWFIRRRDDYFLFIYWNCMIYRSNRNRALHTSSEAHFTRSTSHQKLIEVKHQKGCSKDLIRHIFVED